MAAAYVAMRPEREQVAWRSTADPVGSCRVQ